MHQFIKKGKFIAEPNQVLKRADVNFCGIGLSGLQIPLEHFPAQFTGESKALND